MSSNQPAEIALDMAVGGRFDGDETEAILDAVDLATDQNGTTYLTLKGQRVAVIAPLPAGRGGPGPAIPYVSRITESDGRGGRVAVLAVQVTVADRQLIVNWLAGHGIQADWSDDAPEQPDGTGRLSFGGKAGSYCLPAGYWVLLYEGGPAEGWSAESFERTWIDKSEQDLADRRELAAGVSLYRASRYHR
jgi:hypothetical protein